jgi:hypothetical protein
VRVFGWVLAELLVRLERHSTRNNQRRNDNGHYRKSTHTHTQENKAFFFFLRTPTWKLNTHVAAISFYSNVMYMGCMPECIGLYTTHLFILYDTSTERHAAIERPPRKIQNRLGLFIHTHCDTTIYRRRWKRVWGVTVKLRGPYKRARKPPPPRKFFIKQPLPVFFISSRLKKKERDLLDIIL